MNRLLWKPALLTIIFLVVVTASGLLIRGNTSSDKTRQLSVADEQAPKAAETAKAGETSKTADPAKANGTPKTGDAPTGETAKPGETSKTADPAKPDGTPKTGDAPTVRETPKAAAAPKVGGGPKNADERRQLLETVGVLTAAHCYQAYLNIGLIADGKAKGTYTDKDAYKLLDSVLALLDSVDRRLAVVGKIDLDKEDRASLELMRDLSDLLHQQGKQLEIFWDSSKDEDAAKYENVRKDSWAAISKLMGSGR